MTDNNPPAAASAAGPAVEPDVRILFSCLSIVLLTTVFREAKVTLIPLLPRKDWADLLFTTSYCPTNCGYSTIDGSDIASITSSIKNFV